MPVEKIQYMDAETLLTSPLQRPFFVVEGLIPQGLNTLCGSPKIGKSWLMLWLALQVARGEPLWEFTTHRCDVLYLCLEDTYARIQSRLQHLTEEAPETLRFSVLCQRLGSGLQEHLEDFLRDYPQTRLVIIDTLQKVRDGTVNRGSMYASDYGDMAALKAIADRHNLCMILVHHLRKLTDSADPFNEVSGSTALMGAADTTYLLKKSNRAEEEAILLATGRDIEYQQLVLRFENYHWTLVERKDSAAIQRDDVPPFLFWLVEFVKAQGGYEGSATALLTQMGETEVTPNAVTRYIVRHWERVLVPENICYSTRRTASERILRLTLTHDSNDANDGNPVIEKEPSQPS